MSMLKEDYSFEAAPVMRQLFAESRHSGDDDCLISKKLLVKAFSLKESCIDLWQNWPGKKIAHLENQLDSLGKPMAQKELLQVFRI